MNVGSIGQSIINGTYGSESKPLTAYEELKAWCEKHLETEDYKDVPATETFYHCIYISACLSFNADDNRIGFIGFFGNGSVANMGTVTRYEMNDHIKDYEAESRG